MCGRSQRGFKDCDFKWLLRRETRQTSFAKRGRHLKNKAI
nr:MAG TPA: hypothetical protein [Caudoviricetes sp.]